MHKKEEGRREGKRGNASGRERGWGWGDVIIVRWRP